MKPYRARFSILFLAAFCLLPAAYCAAAIEDVIEATCRVRLQSGNMYATGTGCAFEVRDGEVRILTNYHVAENSPNLQVEFWHRGHKSTTLYAASRWFSFQDQPSHRDVCVIAIPLADFGGYPPTIIPLAPRGTRVSPGEPIVSCGCEEGRWPSAWLGHVVDQPDSVTLRFEPISIPGRSGSALFDEDATQIVGLVGWHDQTYGVAMTLEELYRAFDGEPATVSYPATAVKTGKRIVSVGPSGRRCVHGVSLGEPCRLCPPGGCQPPYQQPSQPKGGSGVYPTQPPGQAAPAAPPPIDTSKFALKTDAEALRANVDAIQAKLDPLTGLPSRVAAHDAAIGELGSKFKSLEGSHSSLAVQVGGLAESSVGQGFFEQEMAKLKTEAIAGAASEVTPIVKSIAGDAIKAAEAKAAAAAGGAAVSALPALAAVGGPVGLALFGGFWLLARGVKKIGGTASGSGGAAQPFPS